MDADNSYRLLFEGIDEKIDFEFEQFFNEMKRTSKSNIFARSSEIEIKKKITRHLKRTVKKLEPELLNRLFSHINILEECYRYHMDHPCADVEKQIDVYLAKQ